jgi:cytoskeletal protein CcmA (bactofilin family)
MKFLAILAVLAMAFAVFAVLTDAETNDAADATVEPAPGTYYISPGTSANPNVRGITTAGDVAALTAGAYVTTASGVVIKDSTGNSTIYVLANQALKIETITSGSVTVVLSSLEGQKITAGDVSITFTAASALTITTTANAVKLTGTSATVSEATINDKFLVIDSIVITNNGVITVDKKAIDVIGTGKITSSTEGAIKVSSADNDNGGRVISITGGTVEKQRIYLPADATSTTLNMGTDGDNWVSVLKDSTLKNCKIYSKTKYGMALETQGGVTKGGEATLTVQDNIFESTDKIKSAVMISLSTTEAMGFDAKVKVVVTGNDFSKLEADSGNEYNAPVRINSYAATVGVKGADAQITLDAENLDVGVAGNATFKSNMAFKYLGVVGSVTVDTGKAVVNNGLINVKGTLQFAKTTNDKKISEVGLQGTGNVDVLSGGKLILNQAASGSDKSVLASGENTIKVKTGGQMFVIETSATDTYWLLIGDKVIGKEEVNNDGPEMTKAAYEADPTKARFMFGVGAESYVTLKANLSGGAVLSTNYTLKGAIDLGRSNDVDKSSGFANKINNYFGRTDTVTFDGNITLFAALVVKSGVTIDVLEGSSITASTADPIWVDRNIDVMGIMNYDIADQVFKNTKIYEGGKVNVKGSGGGTDEKTVIDTTTTDVKAETFTDADVVVATAAVTKAEIPEGKTLVIENTAGLTAASVLDVSKEDAIVSIILGDTAKSFSVKIGTDSIVKVTDIRGTVSFAKGSILIYGDEWTSGTITLKDGDVAKVSGTVGEVTFAYEGDTGSAKILVEKDTTLTIKTSLTISSSKISMDIEGKVTADAAGKDLNNGSSKVNIMKGAVVEKIDIIGSGAITVYSGSNINNINSITNWNKVTGKDADGGEWLWAQEGADTTLQLKGYNGTYNFKAFEANITAISVTGDNVISYTLPKNFSVANTALFGTYEGNITSITTDYAGSLHIKVDISKLESAEINDFLAVIGGAGLSINKVDVTITVIGSNVEWESTDIDDMTVIGIKAATLNLFQAPLTISVMPAVESKKIYGIYTNAGDVTISTDSDVVIAAYNAMDVGNVNILKSDVILTGKSDMTGPIGVAISNSSTLKVIGKYTAGNVKVSQESSLDIVDAEFSGAVSNKGIINVAGSVVVKGENVYGTGSLTNEAILNNEGTIGVYGAFYNKDEGIFNNFGKLLVLDKKFGAAAANVFQITGGDTPASDVTKVKLSAIEFTEITPKADGTADIEAALSFAPAITLKAGTTTFKGSLVPSQTTTGYTLTLSNGTATVSVTYTPTDPAVMQVGGNFTVAVTGSVVTDTDTVMYLEANKTRTTSPASDGATVAHTIAGTQIVTSNAKFVVSGGTINNEGEVVVSSNFNAEVADIPKIITGGTFNGNLTTNIANVTIGGTFNGDLTANGKGTATVGKFFGDITSKGLVVVSADKTMMGDINADGNVTINGVMIGDITTKGSVAIVGKMAGDITVNAAAQTLTVSGELIGNLTYNSEYKATKEATTKTTYTATMFISADMIQEPAKSFIINMAAGADATETKAVIPGFFTFGTLNAPKADNKVMIKLTADGADSKLSIPTSVILPENYEIVIESGTTIEVASTAQFDVKKAALKVSSGATANFETGSGVPVTYGKVLYVMSFDIEGGAYTIYSDVSYALTSCDEGAELTLGENATINSAVAVKKGVNIIVKDVTLTFNGYNVEMDDAAKITLEGTGKVVFKASGDNKEGLAADKEYEYYAVDAVVAYAGNVVVFDGVRFTADSTLAGVAATSTAAAKISATLSYNQGIAKIAEGYGTGALVLGNTSYKLLKADTTDTLFEATFLVGEEAVYDATGITDAFAVVDYEVKNEKVVIKEFKLNATTVAVEGTLNLLNNTEVKGFYSGLGVVTIAAGKEFKYAASDAVPDAAAVNKTIPGASLVLNIANTTDDAAYKLQLLAPKAGTYLSFQATTYKLGTETFNVITISGDVGNGMITGGAAFIKELTIEKEAAVVADGVYVIGAAKSIATGHVGAIVIFMKDTDKNFQELDYVVSFEKDGYTFYTQFGTIDWEEISDITVEKDFVLADDLDVSGKDVTIEVAEDATLTIPAGKKLVIGTPLESIGTISVLSGNIKLSNGAFIVAYSDVDYDDAKFIDAAGTDKVKNSVFTIDDLLYATVFANSSSFGPAVAVTFDEASEDLVPEIEGYIFTTWYLFNEKALNDAYIGETNAYAGAKAIQVYVTVKFVEGVSYYCNGVEFAIYDTPTKVEYDSVFTAKINNTAKYEGTPVINGKNSFIVTEDSVLVASGVNPIPVPPEPEPEPVIGDSGISLTDILLIVLVVLIAIMVVILVLRLNRS